MPVTTARAALIADAATVALVPATRIEPLRSTQQLVRVPAIVLQRVSTVAANHLAGDGDCDSNLVQISIYAADYTKALAIATAVRDAMTDAGMSLQAEIDGYESDPDPELAQITQTWSVFT